MEKSLKIKPIILKSSILIFLIFLYSFISFSQEVDDSDSLLCTIYFTDGFENDSIHFFIGDSLIFENIEVTSNLYYSLTGKQVMIFNNNKMTLIEEIDNDNTLILQESKEFAGGIKHNLIPIKIRYKGEDFMQVIDLNETNYVVIYRKWSHLFFSEFVDQPGFD